MAVNFATLWHVARQTRRRRWPIIRIGSKWPFPSLSLKVYASHCNAALDLHLASPAVSASANLVNLGFTRSFSCHSPLSHTPFTFIPKPVTVASPFISTFLLEFPGAFFARLTCLAPHLQPPSPHRHISQRRRDSPRGGSKVIPSCSDTARWCCWNAAL